MGKQVSQINTQSYGGSECGTTGGGTALLDHTGQYFYVPLVNSSSSDAYCSAVQTYKIANNGALTFLGDTESTDGYHQYPCALSVSTVGSNDLFSYGVQGQTYADVFVAFSRESNGTLMVNSQFKEVDPTPNPAVADSYYFPMAVAADPANHLAALMYEPFANTTPPQLASYTINPGTGSVASTNTYANMPTPSVNPSVLGMSPSGKLLAVAGANGLQVYHFNGASPITPYSGVLLPGSSIRQLGWDNANHLYVLSAAGALYVYSATPTSITALEGSPYQLKNTTGLGEMIVVSK